MVLIVTMPYDIIINIAIHAMDGRRKSRLVRDLLDRIQKQAQQFKTQGSRCISLVTTYRPSGLGSLEQSVCYHDSGTRIDDVLSYEDIFDLMSTSMI